MLELKGISKRYNTGGFEQTAMDHISVAFRDNEFVAILGPSGSGKTTMLNVIGGLDRFDSGDLLVDGISTKKFKERDWDTYRNNRIGFVFQAYNLIPHQSVVSNVELALTLSGVSKSERHERALEAGVRVHGSTVHFVSAALDGGAIIGQAVVPVLPSDTPDTLAARGLKLEHVIYPKVCRAVLEDRVKLVDGKAVMDDETARSLAVFSNEL